MPGDVHVTVFGSLTVRCADGTSPHLSRQRRAVLAALVAAEEPIARPALARCVGLSLKTVNSLLNRLPIDLGLTGPIHRVSTEQKKFILLDRQRVGSDLDEVRRILDQSEIGTQAADRLLSLRVHLPPAELGLVSDNSLSRTLQEGIERVRLAALRRLAWFDLGRPGSPATTGAVAVEPGAPTELWLARLDEIARHQGRLAAKERLLAVESRLADVDVGRSQLPGPLLARTIIETARLPGRSPTRASAAAAAEVLRLVEGELAQGSGARVSTLYWPGAGADDFEAFRRALVSQRPASLVGWLEDMPAVAAVAALAEPMLGAEVRSAAAIPVQLLADFVAIRDGMLLEPASNHRSFCERVADLHRTTSLSGPHLLVVGRRDASSPSMDRMLANLLHHGDQWHLVIVHSTPGVLETPQLRELGVVVCPSASRRPPVAPRNVGFERSTRARRSWSADQLKRMLAIASLAVDGDGHLLEPLADHLLRSARVDCSIADLAMSAPEAFDLSSGLMHGHDDHTSNLQTNDLAWLGSEAIGWLVADGLAVGNSLEVMVRVVPRLPAGPEATAAAVAIRRLAERRSSYGDHEAAVLMLEAALALPVADGELAALLAQSAASRRELGLWVEALADYRRAAELLAGRPELYRQLAVLALAMARLTWDPAVGAEVDRLLIAALVALPLEEDVLRARIDLCLAGGSFQDGRSGAMKVDAKVIAQALDTVRSAIDPAARAWGVVHGRKALLSMLPVRSSLELAREITRHGNSDVALMAHGHQALFVDRLRLGQWERARRELERIERLARTPVSAEQRFSARVARTCWDLATGDVDGAQEGLLVEQTFAPLLGGSTFNQVTLAHVAWLARRRGDPAELEVVAAAAAAMAEAEPGGAIWAAGASLLALDCGQIESAVSMILRYARASGGLESIAPGPHRLPVLAIAAWVAAASCQSPGSDHLLFTARELATVKAALDTVDTNVVLIGWPTVVLGPVDQFRALVLHAMGDRRGANAALDRAETLALGMAGLAVDIEAARALLGRG